ncbi:RUN and FYVE domain-containing protein 1 [Trichostrongylus colubriformis]|uniref:RUN and FYVE domain-containing protein 1 n=1 Tax=Trichostrongylus colubriformis TaxID=6319 RepID=A0AAN8J269_TRICO
MFSSSGFSLVSAFTDDDQRLNRSQKIHRENERANLLTITRIVLRAFLEQTMAENNRILECDTQQVSDLLMMLEKVLWHGFKAPGQKALIVLKSPDAEMWATIVKIAKTDAAMLETATCVDQIESLLTPISRLRAFLRLAMMQKKLFDFYTVISSSPLLKIFYEDWALLRQEEIVQLTGALLGLSVVDCNLVLEHDHLQEQPLSVDLSLYIRIPTLPTEGEDINSANGTASHNKEKKMLLDQNNYLEERNRQLHWYHSKTSITLKTANRLEAKRKNGKKNGSDYLDRQIVEREDSLRIVQQQLVDTKKINTDLYDKLKLADEKWRKLEKDLARVREQYAEESQILKTTISKLEMSNAVLQENVQKRNENDQAIREELEKKYGQHTELVGILQEKQNALAQAESELLVLRRKVDSLEKELKEMPFLKEEMRELSEKYACAAERAEQSERALEELGGHLSESKLRMLELAEELLPLSDAHWANDSDVTQCTACSEKFSLSKRKHHCRMCGSIFCASCSEGRIKLPSNSKPARVCDQCFTLLKNRHS